MLPPAPIPGSCQPVKAGFAAGVPPNGLVLGTVPLAGDMK